MHDSQGASQTASKQLTREKRWTREDQSGLHSHVSLSKRELGASDTQGPATTKSPCNNKIIYEFLPPDKLLFSGFAYRLNGNTSGD